MSEERQGSLKILDAILSINADARVVIRGRDIDTCTIEWHNGTAEISKEDIKAAMEKL
jgi:hypothetical protein